MYRIPALLGPLAAAALAAMAIAGPDVDENTSVRNDAGSTTKTAKVCKGSGTVLSARGALSLGLLTGDPVDLFLVYVPNPSLFSATVATTAPSNLDTQLFLFQVTLDANGEPTGAYAVAGNDNMAAGVPLSKVTFPVGSTQYAPGVYALGVTVSGVRPYTYSTSANGNRVPQDMFTTSTTGLMLPTTIGTNLPLRSWNGTQALAGSYRISFTGTTLIPQGAGTAGCGGVFSGSCYEPHSPRGCNDAQCCEIVCGIDAYCCSATWDTNCAQIAYENCTGCSSAPANPCPGDFNGDGSVNGTDLGEVLNAWGTCQ
jgi:hypothetical protein